MLKKIFSLFLLFTFGLTVNSQNGLKYQKPPKEIVEIMNVKPTPSVSISPDKRFVAFMERTGMPSIADFSGEELRIAGLRIDPAVNGQGRQNYSVGLTIMDINGNNPVKIEGLPADLKMRSFSWSNDGKMFAFLNTIENSVELWLGNVESMSVKKIDGGINAILGGRRSGGFKWMVDNKSIVYQTVVPDREARPVVSQIPEGPVVQENMGRKGATPTFQDLLKNPSDEEVFEYFATSVIKIWNGSVSEQVGDAGIYSSVNCSPDANYILVEEIVKPFSYVVPLYYFPSVVSIWDREGKVVRIIAELPLKENLPRGFDMTFPEQRSFSWRSDKPATLYWVKPLDGGDIKKEMEYHDHVYTLEAPFKGEPVEYVATKMRFGGITWGSDDFAILSESSRKERIRIQYSFNPENPSGTLKQIFKISTDDRYNNPGRFMTEVNEYGRRILLFGNKGRSLYLTGRGSSPEGDRPFIDEYAIKDGSVKRLWRSEAPCYESVIDFVDKAKMTVLTSRESVEVPSNYFIRDLKKGSLKAITSFENPYPMLKGVTRELIKYKRNDGIDLTFDLYLPAGYDKGKDGPLPAILWAYPREFKSAVAAGQVAGSPYRFARVSASSVLLMVTQGYAIFNNVTFPIVGEDETEPNDTFREQLVANAEAAINKGVELGVVDPDRVGVGGHSYGAFMTANLLAHSSLFAAGVARSGAYNRTLTPFGFQNERRTYWEAPDLYNYMAPFMHADKVKNPILLIHGQADNNSGTFPIQSKRFFGALKGHGATVRLCFLPFESHGYAAAESLMHMQWEVLTWFDKYVKNNKQ